MVYLLKNWSVSLFIDEFHVPLLTLAVLYVLTLATCKVPEERDVTDMLSDVGTSALVAVTAASFRLIRSIFRLCISIGVRMKSKGCGQSNKSRKCTKRIAKCLPKPGDAAYPPGKCAQCCIIPFFLAIMLNVMAINGAAAASLSIWFYYIELRTSNVDDSLGIYRTLDDVYVINISSIISSNINETLVSIETIDEYQIHCFSEFQYSEEDSEIYFNTIELMVVSPTGQFCASRSDEHGSLCEPYYTYDNLALYYGFHDPGTNKVKRFDSECTAIKDKYPPVYAGPKKDSSIQVERHIGPTNNKELLRIIGINLTHFRNYGELRAIYSVPISQFINESLGYTFLYTFQDPNTGVDVDRVIRFYYDPIYSRVSYIQHATGVGHLTTTWREL